MPPPRPKLLHHIPRGDAQVDAGSGDHNVPLLVAPQVLIIYVKQRLKSHFHRVRYTVPHEPTSPEVVSRGGLASTFYPTEGDVVFHVVTVQSLCG